MTHWRSPPARPSLERSQIVQALLDCFAVVGAFLFVSVTGLAVTFSIFVLFFVAL